ncbi:23S rRNA (uracil(1939)-C(5))-methyltransferase RlmD [Weissella coleopterorum]|uniref:23S rRNA (Uracil(1939)-C(5))-methyltransferase RlmD n=1 Tax=Weissella coleopterorum TaxID=2714949 RepID=A0A6G8AYV9_9LACO|nr:23S rRNA (uracil(1939)-C(5))-methyltransferase RlmD [Weissella coleopterorum]QIL50177.1 23S rRNA (uracil(1939)-C(5))-methyltransferase RlmD [Weissella coleopterorum]
MPRNILPVKLNEIKEGVVTDILHNGMGVIMVDQHYPVKLVDAFLGEKIRCRLTQVDRLSAYGEVLTVVKPSADRQNQNKAYLLEAGVAPYVNLSYSGQLKLKRRQVEQAFAAVDLKLPVAATIGADQPTHYRNKTVVPLKNQNGHLTTGFFDRKNKDTIVPMDDYYLNDPIIDQTIGIVRDILDQFKTPIYNDVTKQGAMRYIMVRRGYYSQQVMVVLVSHLAQIPDEAAIAQAIVEQVPALKSLILNHNPRQTSQQLTGDNRVLWGDAAIHDQLLGHDFVIGPNSFYQVNPKTTEVLYQLAAQMGELKASDHAIDAYSGIGTIGLSIADQVQQVYGVEVVERAVEDAKINIAQNQIKNAQYIAADAPVQMEKWRDENLPADIIFVDPPRRGLTETLMDAMVYLNPDRVVYVSCNPVTMARDIKYMTEHGYQVQGPIQPLDQFPQTAHVECVALLVNKH